MRLCTNCETMVEDPRAKLCTNCGAVLPGATEAPPSTPLGQMQRPTQRGGNQVARALFIVLAIIGGLAILLFLGLLLLCGVIGGGGGIH